MSKPSSSVIKQYGPHILAVLFFIVLTLIYFKPILQGKTLEQSDITQWRGMVQELREYEKNGGTESAWSGTMFSGMPSYHFGVLGGPENYLSYIQKALDLFDHNSMGPVFAGLLFTYIFFFLLTRNIWLSILGAVAFAFSSYNIIILQAGHVTKAWSIAFMPLVLSGFILIFRNKFLLGGAVFALGLALELLGNHIQITYYLAIFCFIIFVGYAVNCIIKKNAKNLGKATLTLAIGVVLAALPDLPRLYSDFEMSKESLRGPSELTVDLDSGSKPSDGLDIDYAFNWSYGKGETLTLIIPDIRGGASVGNLGPNSHLYKEMRKNGQQVKKEVQSYTYWGEQPSTAGPVYFGAAICFLFLLGMFVIKNNTKWWLLGATIFFIFLAWGRHFMGFNEFLFNYLPFYNKFRTPSMALVIPSLIFPIVAIWGLSYIVKGEVDKKKLKNYILYSLGATGAICLFFWLLGGSVFNFQSPNDARFVSQVPEWYYNALIADRESLLKSDSLRSLIFILLGAACVYLFMNKNKKFLAFSLAGLAILILVDLWTVDKRYLNDSYFVKKKSEQVFEPTKADEIILQDKSPSYRVLNMATSTFMETSTSYFHKSIGGYHAAKLRRYQELIDHRIVKEMQLIGSSFQNATSYEDLQEVFKETPTLNMLNAKYIIYNPEQPPLVNPYADGNAWFVNKIEYVKNADQEMDALDKIDPRSTAVVDEKFASLVAKPSNTDENAVIRLTEYKPNTVKYESNSSSDQVAVFSEVYYKNGWKAFIDGQPVEHYRADWILRAMNIPSGKHNIEFRFEPDTYNSLSMVGSIASIILILGFIGTVVYSLRPKKEKQG